MKVVHKWKVWCCLRNMGVVNYELSNGDIIIGYKALRAILGPQKRIR